MRTAEARKVEGQTAQEPRVVSILRRIVWACILKDLVKENSSTHAHFSSFLRHIYVYIACLLQNMATGHLISHNCWQAPDLNPSAPVSVKMSSGLPLPR